MRTRVIAAAAAHAIVDSSPAVRVGCDVQSVADVERAVSRFGTRYLDRVYTAAEQADCRAGGASSLAGRFAAKEAVLKLLGSADGIDPRSVEVIASGGRPRVRLHGAAARLARTIDAQAIDVSISHDAGVAFAVAVTQVRPPPRSGGPPTTNTTTNPPTRTGDLS